MKVENKLDANGHVVADGGFTTQDETVLRLLANSAVPTIHLLSELHRLNERSRARIPTPLSKMQYASDLDAFFNAAILDAIRHAPHLRASAIHEAVLAFADHVLTLKGAAWAEPLELAKQHIPRIGEAAGVLPELITYAEPLSAYQAILYQLPNYREHFLHQFNVFLIGYLFLTSIDDDRFALFVDAIDGMPTADAEERVVAVFETWFLAAMWHDTGYPIGKAAAWADDLVTKVFQLKESSQATAPNITEPLAARLMRDGAFDWLDCLTDSILKVFSDHGNLPRERVTRALVNGFLGSLSGDIVAALLLIKAGRDKNVDETILTTASTAIAAHDEHVWKVLSHIDFDEHPFAFLLYHADSVQEHGRLRSDVATEAEMWEVTESTVTVADAQVTAKLRYSAKPRAWNKTIDALQESARMYVSRNPRFTIEFYFDDAEDNSDAPHDSIVF